MASAWLILAASTALAGPVLDRMQARGAMRVCIWSDYYGVTWRNPHTQQLTASTSSCRQRWRPT